MKIYEGPSAINGEKIQAILTFNSSSVKTGPMAQLWILNGTTEPHKAQATGEDIAVCGSCPQRPSHGGGCYVTTFQAPLATYRSHKGKQVENLRKLYVPLRFGAYGDPLALPRHILEDLLSKATQGWTGYTHLWGKKGNQWASSFLMASTESESSKASALKKGWKVFHITDELKEDSDLETCANTTEGIQCIDCLKCDGRHGSIEIQAHGVKAKKATK